MLHENVWALITSFVITLKINYRRSTEISRNATRIGNGYFLITYPKHFLEVFKILNN